MQTTLPTHSNLLLFQGQVQQNTAQSLILKWAKGKRVDQKQSRWSQTGVRWASFRTVCVRLERRRCITAWWAQCTVQLYVCHSPHTHVVSYTRLLRPTTKATAELVFAEHRGQPVLRKVLGIWTAGPKETFKKTGHTSLAAVMWCFFSLSSLSSRTNHHWSSNTCDDHHSRCIQFYTVHMWNLHQRQENKYLNPLNKKKTYKE